MVSINDLETIALWDAYGRFFSVLWYLTYSFLWASSPQCWKKPVVAVALYAISAVYFAGVMVRLMLTLTPVVCMLSAIAFSNVFEHYLGDDMKRENPPVEDSSDEDDKRNPGNLYDKVRGCAVSVFPVQESLQMEACWMRVQTSSDVCSFSPLLASKCKS